jgi:hypothetical protein
MHPFLAIFIIHIRFMKKLISLFIGCWLLLPGCTNRDAIDRAMNDYPSETDTLEYPLLIENGTKLVYQFGRMTPDKGLKLYYDTIPYPAEDSHLTSPL